jgi:hypothetical protein
MNRCNLWFCVTISNNAKTILYSTGNICWCSRW